MSDILGANGTLNLALSVTIAASDHTVHLRRILKATALALLTNYVAGRIASLTMRKKGHDKAKYSYEAIHSELEPLPLASASHSAYRVALSRSHQTPETHAHVEELRAEHPDLEIVEQGSSYKFCLLAEGSVDYYIRTTTTSEWDTAAGELILSESGGLTLSYPDGVPLYYNKESLDNPWFVARRV
jgi:3'(2'), 5'-bisphosphate nucleotidase